MRRRTRVIRRGSRVATEQWSELAGPTAIDAALRETARETAPIELQLNGWGLFGGRRPRVVWAGLAGEIERLADCAARLDTALEVRLAEGDFRPEGRPFRPHLTIARVPDRVPNDARIALRAAVAALTPPSETPWRVNELHLIRSHLGADPYYETLASHLFVQRLRAEDRAST